MYALQRTIGNRLTTGAIQRATLVIRKPPAANAGTISGVTIGPDRPPSNVRGSQGHHRTAYVAFKETIRSSVRDRTLEHAARQLVFVASEFQLLPYINPNVHQGFQDVITALTNAIGQPNLKDVMGRQIDELLRVRNIVPNTAVAKVTGQSRGERYSAGDLGWFESHLRTRRAAIEPQALELTGDIVIEHPDRIQVEHPDLQAEQSVEQMWALLDYDPPDPGLVDALHEITRTVLTHLLSMRLAFPHVFDWLTWYQAPKYELLTYLLAHRNIDALPRLSNDTILQVQDIVNPLLR